MHLPRHSRQNHGAPAHSSFATPTAISSCLQGEGSSYRKSAHKSLRVPHLRHSCIVSKVGYFVSISFLELFVAVVFLSVILEVDLLLQSLSKFGERRGIQPTHKLDIGNLPQLVQNNILLRVGAGREPRHSSLNL